MFVALERLYVARYQVTNDPCLKRGGGGGGEREREWMSDSKTVLMSHPPLITHHYTPLTPHLHWVTVQCPNAHEERVHSFVESSAEILVHQVGEHLTWREGGREGRGNETERGSQSSTSGISDLYHGNR